MDTNTLVEPLLEDGRKLVEHLLQRGFEVSVAMWLRTNDDNKWFFYIVSPIVDAEGSLNGYKQLLPLVREMPQPFSIEPMRIKILGATSPIGRDVLADLARYCGPRISPIRWPRIWLGDTSIDGAYLYPSSVTTP